MTPPWTIAHQALLSLRFPRQEYWSGLPFPPPGDLPDSGTEPASPALAGRFFTAELVGSMLLLLLSRFSHVRLCATSQTAAHQAPPSLGFSRQEYWSGLHFLLQCVKVKSESEVAQLCPTLCNLMDCSLRGSSVHGILQARVLEWGACAFAFSG